MSKSKNQEPGITWRQPDGRPVSYEEKLDEIPEYCQEALEDALLMDCDERQVREVFESIVKAFQNPYGGMKN